MSTTDNTTPQNLTFARGDDIPFSFAFTDINNNPLPLTGYTLYLTIKRNKTDTDAQAVVATSYTASVPLSGIIASTVSHTVTMMLLGLYYYDFRVVTNTGQIFTIVPTRGITFEIDTTTRIY